VIRVFRSRLLAETGFAAVALGLLGLLGLLAALLFLVLVIVIVIFLVFIVPLLFVFGVFPRSGADADVLVRLVLAVLVLQSPVLSVHVAREPDTLAQRLLSLRRWPCSTSGRSSGLDFFGLRGGSVGR